MPARWGQQGSRKSHLGGKEGTQGISRGDKAQLEIKREQRCTAQARVLGVVHVRGEAEMRQVWRQAAAGEARGKRCCQRQRRGVSRW